MNDGERIKEIKGTKKVIVDIRCDRKRNVKYIVGVFIVSVMNVCRRVGHDTSELRRTPFLNTTIEETYNTRL